MNKDEAIKRLSELGGQWKRSPFKAVSEMCTDFEHEAHLNIDGGLYTAEEVAAIAVIMGYSESRSGGADMSVQVAGLGDCGCRGDAIDQLPPWPKAVAIRGCDAAEAQSRMTVAACQLIDAFRARLKLARRMLVEAATSPQAEMDEDLARALLDTAEACREPQP